MKVLFVEKDPLVRGLWHCLCMAHGIEHGLASTATEAWDLLRGEITGRAPLWTGCYGRTDELPAVIVVNPDLEDDAGGSFLRELRRRDPHSRILGHTTPDAIRGGQDFDRVFFKPNAEEAVFRAVLGILENVPEYDLFSRAAPQDAPAA
jgi:hypothetical protein